MSASARLKYRIVRCTSEDPEYPASELLAHSTQTKGWQTARFCDFPQEMVLQFETPVHLRKVEFLSHQSKIATKIELFVGMPAEGQECRPEQLAFKRLGYLSLDSNERSDFQARELKSVYVDISAQCLRLLFHKCHVNRYNIVNQVGLIALNCLGEALGPDLAVGQPPPNPALGRGPSKPSPSPAPAAPVAEQAQDAAQAAADEMRYDGKTLERIRALTVAKQRAVEAEDYEEAKRCKDMLGKLRETGLLLRQLEDRKKAAVQNEDYDAAKALKSEIERVRMSIERPQAASPAPEEAQRTPQGRPPPARSTPSPPPFAEPQDQPQPQEWRVPPQAVPQQVAPRGYQPRVDQSPRGGFPGDERPSSPGLFGPPPGGAAAAPPPFEGIPARETVVSPPLPANAGGAGARVVHSPVAGAGPGGPGPCGAQGMPERPVEREPSSHFDAASHPLAGVPNIEDLGQPDPVPASAQNDAASLIPMLGEYVTQCFFSKSWNLRDAALQKVALDLNEGKYDREHPTQVLAVLALLLKKGLADKNVQVVLSCGPLLQALSHRLLARGQLRQQEVHQELEPIMPLLAERLGDANARVDKMSRDVHVDFARCATIGAGFAANHALRPPKKKTVPPRVYSSRLQLLAALVAEVGLQPESPQGLSLEAAAKLAMEWFSNSNADVRESSVKLMGVCFSQVGLDRIEPFLANLRQVQREIFDAEFERVSGGGGDAGHSPPPSMRGGRQAAPSPRAAGGWGDLPPPQVPPPRDAAGADAAQEYAEGDDPTVCQFCMRQDNAFTPEVLDVHYWKECPMLSQCEFCQQVIEIATLREHLLEECEGGASAQAHAASLPPGRCALCLAAVSAGTDEDWRQHLLAAGCPKNPRNEYRRFCPYSGRG